MNRRGFTLIELLVVLVIIAVSSSLIYLNVGRAAVDRQARQFSRELAAMTRKARSLAVSQGEPVVFVISPSERICRIQGANPVLEIPEEVSIEGEGIQVLDFGVYAVFFYPDGSSSGAVLGVSSDGRLLGAFRVDMLTGILTPIAGAAG